MAAAQAQPAMSLACSARRLLQALTSVSGLLHVS